MIWQMELQPVNRQILIEGFIRSHKKTEGCWFGSLGMLHNYCNILGKEKSLETLERSIYGFLQTFWDENFDDLVKI